MFEQPEHPAKIVPRLSRFVVLCFSRAFVLSRWVISPAGKEQEAKAGSVIREIDRPALVLS